MPLTPFQREVARLLAANRNPESHVAGGAVINRGPTGLRISDDLDIFHDAAKSVAASAEADERALRTAGCDITWTLREPAIIQAEVTRGGDRVRLDWTTDSAFRFFPVQPDTVDSRFLTALISPRSAAVAAVKWHERNSHRSQTEVYERRQHPPE